MNTADLKEYLSIVLDMEQSIYLKKKLITELKATIKSLGHPREIPAPMKPVPKKSSEFGVHLALIAFFILFIPSIIISALIVAFTIQDLFFPYNIFIIAVLIDLLGILVMYIANQDSEKKEAVKRQKSIQLYNQARMEHEEKKRQDALRVVSEKQEAQFLQKELKEVQVALERSTSVLNQIYAQNIIYPKYRNIVMVCSLHEDICSGRCTSLEGHEGAYNILESEIRLDRITSQLDTVIAELEQIKNNQSILYMAIQESNRNSAQLLNETRKTASCLQNFQGQAEKLTTHIEELRQTSALTAYHTERAQKELHYMNRMNYLSGRYDNVFSNVPPV